MGNSYSKNASMQVFAARLLTRYTFLFSITQYLWGSQRVLLDASRYYIITYYFLIYSQWILDFSMNFCFNKAT